MPKLLLAMNTGKRAVPHGRSGTPAIMAKNASAQRGTSPSAGCHSLQSASGTRSPPSRPSTGCRLRAVSPRSKAAVVTRASPSGVTQPLAVSATVEARGGDATAAVKRPRANGAPPAAGMGGARTVGLIGLRWFSVANRQTAKQPSEKHGALR